MSNVVVSLAIIGKNNEPLYLKEFVDRNNERQDHFDEGELFGLVSQKATATRAAESNSLTHGDGATTEGDALNKAADPSNEYDHDDDKNDDDDILVDYSGGQYFKAIPISLKQEFILHAALDRFEQMSGPPPGYAWRRAAAAGNTTGTSDGSGRQQRHPMYMGLLCPVEDLRVYGFITTTQIKFFVVVVDDPPSLHNKNYNSHDTPFLSGPTAGANHPGFSDTTYYPAQYQHVSTNADQYQSTDVLLQHLFIALHQGYVSYMLNPFSPLMAASSIVSKLFDEQIQDVIARHNRFCFGQK